MSYSDPYGLKGCPDEDKDKWKCEDRIESTALDPSVLIPIGGVARGLAGLVRAVAGAGARDAAELGAREIATTLARNATKGAAREVVEGAGLPAEQAAAARSAISRATASTGIDIIQQRGGNVLVNLTREGRNGFQLFQSAIAPNGAKNVTQFGVDQAGSFAADVKAINW